MLIIQHLRLLKISLLRFLVEPSTDRFLMREFIAVTDILDTKI